MDAVDKFLAAVTSSSSIWYTLGLVALVPLMYGASFGTLDV